MNIFVMFNWFKSPFYYQIKIKMKSSDFFVDQHSLALMVYIKFLGIIIQYRQLSYYLLLCSTEQNLPATGTKIQDYSDFIKVLTVIFLSPVKLNMFINCLYVSAALIYLLVIMQCQRNAVIFQLYAKICITIIVIENGSNDKTDL